MEALSRKEVFGDRPELVGEKVRWPPLLLTFY